MNEFFDAWHFLHDHKIFKDEHGIERFNQDLDVSINLKTLKLKYGWNVGLMNFIHFSENICQVTTLNWIVAATLTKKQ